MTARELFLEELARALDYWINEATNVLTSTDASLTWTDEPGSFRTLQQVVVSQRVPQNTVRSVAAELFRGFAVSCLTIIDGGTELAENVSVRIVDEAGRTLSDSLHDDFVTHLISSGRMQ